MTNRLTVVEVRRLLVAAIAGVLLLASAPAASARTWRYNPVLFVHGIEGSGAQFESQALRFESNRYPATWLDQVDYNSTRAVGDKSEVHQQIDAAIADLKARTGKAQVDVVAHYLNVDGQDQNPGVPTLAVWAGRGTPGRSMDGAENVTIPNQTHVQTCT